MKQIYLLKITASFLLVCYTLPIYSQENIFSKTILENYSIEILNIDKGLKQENVTSAHFDSLGNLWMNNQSYIIKYNGQSFKYFNHKSGSEFSPGRFTTLFPLDTSRKIYYSDSKGYFFITVNGDLLPYKKEQEDQTIQLNDSYIDYLVNGKSRQRVFLPDSTIDNFYFQNNFYCLTIKNKQLEVYLFDEKLADFQPLGGEKMLCNEEITLLQPTSNQRTFFWNDNKIYELFITRDSFYANVVLDGLLEAPYQFDYLADSKLIMVLTNYGMCYLLKRPALSVDILSKGKSYYSVAQLNSTTFATDDFALWRVTNEGNREIPIKNTIESRYDRLDNRLLDKWSSGVLAIETENLFEVDTNLNISKRTYPEFFNNSKPIAIEKSKNENYWVITDEETLCKVDKNFKVLKQLSLPLTVNNDYNFIDELPNNWTYISGGDNKNLYKVHSETLQLDSISFFKDKPVRAIHSLSQDTLLIATYGFGIFGLIDDQIIPLPLDKNEAVLYSSSLVPDDLGTLWISTNNGLLRINLEETKCYLNGNCERVFYNRYSKNDGLLTNEFNGGRGPAFVKLNSQKLIFPSMNGLVVINPEKSIPNDKSKNLRFDQIYIDEKQVDFIEQLTLPADFKRLKVNVSTTFWGKKENLLIEYKIEGFDDRWYPLNDKKLIEVNNIGSGDYILKVRTHKGLIASGLGGYYAISTLPFTILPHFYETRLFIVTSLLFVFLILYFIYRYRLKFLQNLNIELQKEIDIQTAEIIKQNKVLAANVATKSIFMNIIAHDITSPLNFLELTVKTLKNKIIDQIYDKEAKEQLMNVSLIVSNLNQMTKNYLRWLKVINPSSNNNQAKKFNVHKVVEEVLLILQPMLKSNGINSINNIPVDTSFYFIPDALKVILHNLIDNIMKYGKATELELSYFSTEKSSGILLKDNSQSKLNIDSVNQFFALNTDEGDFSIGVGGLGFIIIREMLELSNGNLSVSSNISKGFTYKISISTKE